MGCNLFAVMSIKMSPDLAYVGQYSILFSVQCNHIIGFAKLVKITASY